MEFTMVGEQKNPVQVIILSIVTCGIYYYYWMYTISNEQKEYLADESINPTVDLLIAIFGCGVGHLLWNYRQGERIKRMYEKKGLQTEDESTIYLVLGLFFNIAAIYMIQDKINKLYE